MVLTYHLLMISIKNSFLSTGGLYFLSNCFTMLTIGTSRRIHNDAINAFICNLELSVFDARRHGIRTGPGVSRDKEILAPLVHGNYGNQVNRIGCSGVKETL